MKIVLCANTSWFLYNFCKTLIFELQDKNHEVATIAPFDKHTHQLQELGVEWRHIDLHQTSKNPFKELRAFVQLLALLKNIQPDFIFTYTIKCNLYAGLLSQIFRFSQIATIAGLGESFNKKSLLNVFLCYFYKIAFKTTQRVFFQNHEDFRFFIQRGLLAEKQAEKIPGLGVNLSRFTPAPSCNTGQKRIFLMFGRVLPQKGYALFLEAARIIKEQQEANAEFRILGIEDVSRKESRLLFQMILDYHAQHIITYLPPTDNVIPILQQSDVVVLPSGYNEGVPSSLLEAMACAKPIITTDWKGCRDAVDDGVNGCLIEKENLESLKQAINFFIHADRQTIDNMGKASLKKVEQEFDEQSVIAKFLAEIDGRR